MHPGSTSLRERSRLVSALLAALAWAALGLQLLLSLRLSQQGGHGAAHGLLMYLGYFTVLSNLFVAIVASRAAFAADGGRDLQWRGCAVASIVVVGLGYHLLLRHVWEPQGWQEVADLALHYAVPLAALAWWLALPPRTPIATSAPLRWLLWPVAYGIYALVRGAVVGSYPYYFIDVGALGLPPVLLNLAGLLVVFVLIGYGIRALAEWRRTKLTAATA